MISCFMFSINYVFPLRSKDAHTAAHRASVSDAQGYLCEYGAVAPKQPISSVDVIDQAVNSLARSFSSCVSHLVEP